MRRSPVRLIAALTGCLTALLAGCAPGPGTDTGSSAQPSSTIDWKSFQGQKLTYVYFTDGPDEQATRTAIQGFEKATGATVDLQIVPFADLEKSLQARLSGNNQPEVARVSDWRPYQDQLVDFTSYFGKDYPNEFIPGEAQAASDSSGHLLAVPSDLTMNGPFVNVDAFAKAGVPVPKKGDKWTWDDLVTAAKKVQAANNMEFALAIDKSGHRVSTVLSEFGTTMVGADGKNTLDTGKATKTLTELTGLMGSGAMSKDFWLESGSKYKGANDMFLAGAVPVYLSGNWQVGQFAKNAKFIWAAVPNPCAERCGGFPGGKYMVAFKGSKNPALGAAFTQWMNRTENQRQIDQTASWLPTRKDLVSSGVTYPQRADDMAVFLDDVAKTPADTYAANAAPAFSGSAKALVAEMAKVVAGQEDVPAAVTSLHNQIDQLVATAGK